MPNEKPFDKYQKKDDITIFSFWASLYAFDWVYDAIAFDKYVLEAFVIGKYRMFQEFSQCKNT